jgi:Tol biopolymer transport system component
MRQISPDGTTIVWTENHERPVPERGVYVMDADGANRRQIIRTQDVYDVTPNRHLFPVEDVTVGNTKWTPDGRHLLLTIWVGLFERPGQFERPGIERSLYVADRDGRDLRWLTYFGHHHSWTPDGSSVLYCGWLDPDTKREPRLFLIDTDGANRRVAIDEPLGGHPLMSPDGSLITTWDDHGVILVHVREQRSEYLATFGAGFDMSHRGTHPHPVWRRDGAQLLYNSAQFGHSQLCLARVPGC